MKNLLSNTLALILLINSTLLMAQVIPSYDFEKWENGLGNPPNDWSDWGLIKDGVHTVTGTIDHYEGNYAVKIENTQSGINLIGGELCTTRPGGEEGFGAAFPINQRYHNLKGFYKYFPTNGDTAQIIVFITKTGYVNPQGWGDLLAFGQNNLVAANVYTPFSIGYSTSTDFIYFDNTTIPDSGYIDMASYKMFENGPGQLSPLGKSTLFVDALNFDDFLNGIPNELNLTSKFNLFPTQSKGNFTVEFTSKRSEYTSITMYDMEGKAVKKIYNGLLNQGDHTFNYEFSELNSGTYLFVIASENGYIAEKIVIQ